MTSEAAPLAYASDLEFRVLAHIPVGDDPRGIAVVTETNTIYVLGSTRLPFSEIVTES